MDQGRLATTGFPSGWLRDQVTPLMASPVTVAVYLTLSPPCSGGEDRLMTTCEHSGEVGAISGRATTVERSKDPSTPCLDRARALLERKLRKG
jgi:hypothetical protein